MKGIVLASHGQLAEAVLKTSELFFEKQAQIMTCCLGQNDDPKDYLRSLEDSIRKVDDGEGVIVLCDIFGGTPSNCLAQIITENTDIDISVITGMNLSMFLQLVFMRSNDDIDLEKLMNNSRNDIIDLNRYIKENI